MNLLPKCWVPPRKVVPANKEIDLLIVVGMFLKKSKTA